MTARTPIEELPDAERLIRALEIEVPGGGTVSAIFHGAMDSDAKDIHVNPDDVKPPRPPTLVIMAHHAPGGHKAAENDIFGDLELHLAQEGFSTIRFDFRGCGTSPGRPDDTSLATMAADMAAVHQWAANNGFERLVHIGDGIGALAVLMNMNEAVRALVLLWPILKPTETYFAEAFARMDEAAAAGETALELLGERVGIALLRELRDLDIVRHIHALRAPVLIQHGEDDQHIPLSQIDILKRWAVKARRIEITTYEGGTRGLRQLQERQTLLYHTRQFLRRYC